MVTKDEVRKKLAEAHYDSEPGITEIFTVSANAASEALASEPIKLLEVNENTIPNGIMPLGFDAAPGHGIPYASIIIEVTPEELGRIRRRELVLPHDWTLGPLLPRSPIAQGSRNGDQR
jgi:hypothetical protein